MAEFAKDPIWDKVKLELLADRVGLSTGQIYKWNWDQRKK
jgi:hypothetical protein